MPNVMPLYILWIHLTESAWMNQKKHLVGMHLKYTDYCLNINFNWIFDYLICKEQSTFFIDSCVFLLSF